jgi:hypothetical protein
VIPPARIEEHGWDFQPPTQLFKQGRDAIGARSENRCMNEKNDGSVLWERIRPLQEERTQGPEVRIRQILVHLTLRSLKTVFAFQFNDGIDPFGLTDRLPE